MIWQPSGYILIHSWGDSPKQKAREKEYNHEYYLKNKDKWGIKTDQSVDGEYKEAYITRGKNDYGDDRKIGIDRDKRGRNTISVYDTKHSYWDDKATTKKVGPVTYQRAEDGTSLTLDLNYGKQKIAQASQAISNGKNILDKIFRHK